MKKELSLNTAMERLGRREFLHMLCGMAGAVLLRPAWNFNFADQTLPVPPTLMLHTKDRWKLQNIVRWLNDNGYNSINYRTFAQVIRGEATLPDKPIILTLDDVGTHFIQPYFMDMIDLIEKGGYKGMLGLVTRQTPSENKETWSKLREVAARGWQLDTHTTHHWALPPIKKEDVLQSEIVDSAKMIGDGIDQSPGSLIAPYADVRLPNGQMDQRIFDLAKQAGLDFVVGMAQGRHITGDEMPPYYLGRVGVGVDSVQTAWWITHFNLEKP
jgi:peptidoglycan/xylan/chitin deacetylase (PgdA/CDA1 family)